MLVRVFLSVLFFLTLAHPGLAAEVTTYSGADKRIYVRHVSRNITEGSVGWGRTVGAGYWYSGEVGQNVIFRGEIAISDERFIELLETVAVAPVLTRKFRDNQNRFNFGLILATVGGGTALAAVALHQQTWAFPAAVSGIVLEAVGGGIALANALRTFSTEEAVDAAEAYNATLKN
jgi:hypothetical protein